MASIVIESEKQLIEKLKKSDPYSNFLNARLKPKTDRELKAWKLLQENRGHYSRETLNKVFDIVDIEGEKTRWFGSLLATPNKNLIFESKIEQISEWIELICFSGQAPDHILEKCLGDMKIKGASKGLATLLLYLTAPEKYAIWVNKTYDGLLSMGRMINMKSTDWGKKYIAFNENAQHFRSDYKIDARALDWLLSFAASYVTFDGLHYEIDEDVLE